MANDPISVTLDDIVRRARSAIGEGRYKLGKGGRVPRSSSPLQNGECDCSGFAAWACGVDRYQPDKINGDEDWVETSAIVRDATGPAESFIRMNERRPGYLLVWGDRQVPDRKRPGKTRTAQGHVGVISEVDAHGKVTKVIHCSMGNYRTKGAAIAETDPNVFLTNGAITVKFRGTLERHDPKCVGVR